MSPIHDSAMLTHQKEEVLLGQGVLYSMQPVLLMLSSSIS
jgi:hypothetical protein